MFERLKPVPPDSILQLMLDCQADPNPNKVDLSAGVYKDATGVTPIMGSVKEAERRRISSEETKTYAGIAGNLRFNELITELALGSEHAGIADNRVNCVQTPGGSGALRVAAELIADAKPRVGLWLSDPSWANHPALLGQSGLPLHRYPYYDRDNHSVLFEQMCHALGEAREGDVVVLHGSCHNPCGADLTIDQWLELKRIVSRQKLIPLIDVAYQGMGQDLTQDAAGWRALTEAVPESLIAYSCSKIFGIYRERTGALMTISRDVASAQITLSNLLGVVRQIYSMPPEHGAFLVAEVLSDPQLKNQWLSELEEIRVRIAEMRRLLGRALTEHAGIDFSFIEREYGMFSFFGFSPKEVDQLAVQHSVYIVNSSRASIAGVTSSNVEYIARSVAAVLKQR